MTANDQETRMNSDDVQELQVLQAEMLATAADLGVTVPEDLALEFSTAATGRATCDSLHKLIASFRAGVDEQAETAAADEAPADETPSPKPKRKRSAPRKDKGQVSATTENEPEAAEQPQEEKSEMTDETKPAKKAAKKPAKAAKAPKAAPAKKPAKAAKTTKAPAKKAAPAKKDKAPKKAMPAAKKYGENAKIKVIDKNPAALAKKSKWADRLRKVLAANGKKVKDSGVPIGDIRTAAWRGVIEVVE